LLSAQKRREKIEFPDENRNVPEILMIENYAKNEALSSGKFQLFSPLP